MARRPSIVRRRALAASLILTALGLSLAACKREPLPEHQSAAAAQYVRRCGQCHIAYDPRTLTASMWEKQVEAMDVRMAQGGVAPLKAGERAEILDYLRRNAGGR
ncbi:MAG: hypothetical protein ACREQF_08915 [Candidatus Binataceae bacterium]